MTTSLITQESLLLRASIKNNKRAILSIAEKYGVENLRIFGSVAEGTAGVDSDIDILVDRGSYNGSLMTHVRMAQELEAVLGTSVDVVFSDSLKDNVAPYVMGGELIWVD